MISDAIIKLSVLTLLSVLARPTSCLPVQELDTTFSLLKAPININNPFAPLSDLDEFCKRFLECWKHPSVVKVMEKVHKLRKDVEDSTQRILEGNAGKNTLKKLVRNELLLDHFKYGLCVSKACKEAMAKFDAWKLSMGSGKVHNRWGRKRRDTGKITAPKSVVPENSMFNTQKRGLSLVDQFVLLRKWARHIIGDKR
ncbi:unnamed protein product [Owenia fusiformis]|uniref:Uncharacterized protein n=1 Tax=Owenia fusiformis TaxID=6347 RepID=A0A8J1U984_OWEFU|nr:unnamed protein product [Owenia fusiformis]